MLLQLNEAFSSRSSYSSRIVFDKQKKNDVLRISYLEKTSSGSITVYKNGVLTDIGGALSASNFKSINVSVLPPNGLIGIWFRRVIKSQVFEKVEDMHFLERNFGVYIFHS